jgi:hypothetical protein
MAGWDGSGAPSGAVRTLIVVATASTVGVWISAQLVAGAGVDGAPVEQLVACAAGPVVVACATTAIRAVLGSLRNRPRGPGVAVPVLTTASTVVALTCFSIAVAISGLIGLQLRASGFWTHVAANAVTITTIAALCHVEQWFRPRGWHQPATTAVVALALWLTAVLPGATLPEGPVWQQVLGSLVLASVIVLSRGRYTTIDSSTTERSYGTGHSWSTGYGSRSYGGWSMSNRYSRTTTTVERTTEPLVPNLLVTVPVMAVVAWLSSRFEAGPVVERWLLFLPAMVLLGVVLSVVQTALWSVVPPLHRTTVDHGTEFSSGHW